MALGIPIIIGATGTVSISLDRHIEQLYITILQKQAVIHSITKLSKVFGDTIFVDSTTNAQKPASDTQQTQDMSYQTCNNRYANLTTIL